MSSAAAPAAAPQVHGIMRVLRQWAVTGPRTRQRRLLFDALLLGVAGVFAARVFDVLLRLSSDAFLRRFAGYVPPGLTDTGDQISGQVGPHGLWLVPVATTVGGLLVGAVTHWLSPEAEGHGTDVVVRSFHLADGALRGRVAPAKVLASALTIGSGGAAGREGPIALAAAAIGSWYAGITGRGVRDRRLLLLVGAAAGLSAIFRSPVGAAFFVVEVLYADMEFEPGALLYAMLASIVAYALNGMFVGWGPLFRVPDIRPLHSPVDYAWYAVLGAAAGVFATALPMLFYRTRDLFQDLPMNPMLKPALGGLLTGFVILVFPAVLGGGYGWMQEAIDGRLALAAVAALSVAKMLAMSLTVGSGGSGGVFAPSLFVGAMLGSALAGVGHLPNAPFVIVGMAAVFAGAAHVPIATMLMVTEMTGGYTLLVPAALAVMVSYFVQSQLAHSLRYRSIYEAQVATIADSPSHHAQHMAAALRILRQHPFRDLRDVGEVDLVELLRSGIPVELSDGRRLTFGVLRADSPLVGTTLAASGRGLAGEGTNVLAIMRGQILLAPRADTTLLAGDRLFFIATASGVAEAAAHLVAP